MRRMLIIIPALALLTAGCVTVEKPAADDTPLPRGMVRPAVEARVRSARVEAALQPLGVVPFDGQVLPLVSPDGRHMAVEEGETPDWRALLARDDAGPPVDTRVTIYEAGRNNVINKFTTGPGILLGRSCDDSGFLVEKINADSSRWIGYVAWDTGDMKWLVKDENINAFAFSGRDGSLAWCRRRAGESGFSLVFRAGVGETELPAEGGSYFMPCLGNTDKLVFTWRVESDGRLNLLAIKFNDSLDDYELLAVQTIAAGTDETAVYQSLAGVADPTGIFTGQKGKMLFFHPLLNRMAVFDIHKQEINVLDPLTMAGAWLPDGSLLLTRENELVRRLLSTAANINISDGRQVVSAGKNSDSPTYGSAGEAVVVVHKPLVPRAVPENIMPVLLFGPAGDSNAGLNRLSITRLKLIPAP